MNNIAEKNNLQSVNGYPQVNKEILSSFNRSKLVIENQWASHPSIDDRIKKLEDLNIYSKVSDNSAWNFFVNTEDLQKEITEKLFRNWQFADSPINLSLEEFEIKYLEELSKNLQDERYSYFYQYRNISRFELKSILGSNDESSFKNFEEIYTKENLNLIYQFTGLTSDIRIIESISKGEFIIDVFEYDGSKYKSKESKELCDKLIKIHEEMYKKITELDENIFRFFYSLAAASGREEKLVNKYEIYFYMVDEDKTNLQVYLDLIDAIQFIYRVHSFSQIKTKMAAMKEKENIFRERVKKLLNDENYHFLISDLQKEKFQYYVNNNLIYFDNQKYDQETLKILEETIYQFYEVCSRAPFYSLKMLLDFQTELLDS
jgi:hypothetical protein